MRNGDVVVLLPKATPVQTCETRNWELTLVVLSIGAASHFLLFLDSVVDNLLPAATPFLVSIYGTKERADQAWELLVSSRIYGLAIGCLISIFIPPHLGRKPPVLVGTLLDIAGVVLSVATVYVPGGIAIAVIGRFINGIGHGIVQTAGSVMLAEIPPIRRRGTALATLTMWACLGELGGMLVSVNEMLGNEKGWHLAMGVPLLPLIPAFLILYRAPDSPRFLFMQGRVEEARKSLAFYQNADDARITIEEIMVEMKDKKEHDIYGRDVDINANSFARKTTSKMILEEAASRLRSGLFVRPLLVALFVQAFVHFDDWLWVSYSTQIFENAGLTVAGAQKASLFMSLPQAFISIALLGCFDNFSRRSLLLIPTAFSALLGLIAILYIRFEKALFGALLPLKLMLPILASLDLSAAAVAGESAFAIVPELFLPQDKILGTALVGITQNVFGGSLTTFLLTAVNKTGTASVLVPFVIANVVYVIVNYKYLPETAHKTPFEVAMNFSESFPGIRLFTWMHTKFIMFNRSFNFKDAFTFRNFFNVCLFIAQVFLLVVLMDLALGAFRSLPLFGR